MEKLVIVAFCLLIIQGLMTYLQIKSYQRKVIELKKYGIIGIGTKRGGFNAGSITILVANPEGVIVRCEKMEGLTVFARFKEVESVRDITLKKLKEDLEAAETKKNNKGKKSSMLQAIESLEARLSDRKTA